MKQRVRFGIDIRRQLTGADLYVRIFQICSLLPLPYLFLAMIDPVIGSTRNIASVLFDIGMSALPRAETFALSFLYHETISEEKVYFIILIIAIALGFAADRVLRGYPDLSVRLHKLFEVLICLDLAVRIVPIRANYAFGIPAAVTGWAIRALCLALLIKDMKAYQKQKAAQAV